MKYYIVSCFILLLSIILYYYKINIHNELNTFLHSSISECNDISNYLTDVMPIKGFHILCINGYKKNNIKYFDGISYLNGMNESKSFSNITENNLFITLEKILEISTPKDEYALKYKQSWSIFTPNGIHIIKNDLFKITNKQIIFLFEGGQFIWPGIRIGHKTLIKDVTGLGDITMVTISMLPLIFSIEKFLKDDEIDIILELSKDHLKPSGVSLLDGHEGRAATDWRTSTTYFLPSIHSTIKYIDKRIYDLTKVNITHQETLQVLRYEKTQKYDAHTDHFPYHLHLKNKDLLEKIQYGYNNRMITVFWYMSDVIKGGHTVFPRAGGLPPPNDLKSCKEGLLVKPQKGKVIVFYSMLPSGEEDPYSLHGGCPVIEGIKYSGNKWIWNKPR